MNHQQPSRDFKIPGSGRRVYTANSHIYRKFREPKDSCKEVDSSMNCLLCKAIVKTRINTELYYQCWNAA
jgi:hypothetical protein